MKGFLNLTRMECIAIAPELFKNADVLIDTAVDASQKGNHGVACSLTILGTEELVKAFVIFLNGIGVNVFKIKELRKVFKDHIVKHETAILINVFNTISIIVSQFEEKAKYKSNTGNKWGDLILSGLRKGLDILGQVADFGSVVLWWENANDLKNNGLYVGYRDTLLLPKNITEEIFLKVKEQSDKVRSQIRLIKILAKKNESKTEIVTLLNEGLALYEK